MILLIGSNGCSRCNVTQRLLKQKNVEFEYKLLEDLELADQNKYLDMAENAGYFTLPLIIKDNKLIDIKDV